MYSVKQPETKPSDASSPKFGMLLIHRNEDTATFSSHDAVENILQSVVQMNGAR
jgi:hypothetical protein